MNRCDESFYPSTVTQVLSSVACLPGTLGPIFGFDLMP